MSHRDPEEAIAAFVDAFNAEDLDALESVISPTVEIQTRRGLARGRDEARAWATRTPSGELHQRLVLEGVRADGHPPVALIHRQWFWGSGTARSPSRRSWGSWSPSTAMG